MPDFRAFLTSADLSAREIRLDPEESHHLITVNRCGAGDPVVVFDGRGHEWICECREPHRSGAVLKVREFRTAAPRIADITLAQALPKGATMDEIVRQATEIGAARIVPLLSERTQVQLEGDRAEKKVEKWRTTAIEAAKQCGNPWLPEISGVRSLRDFTANPGDYDLKLVASLHRGSVTLKAALAGFRTPGSELPRRVLWLVGPEGDLSPQEMTSLLQLGFTPVTLGPLVLRCDTAAAVALGVISHELSN